MDKPILRYELLLVRHGQSNANAGTHTGDTPRDRQDSELSASGVLQAQLLGERFRTYALDALYSSGLLRAVHTADAVARYQPPNGAHTVQILPLLTECNIRESYTGCSLQQIQKTYPAVRMADGWTDPRTVLPNDEDLDEIYNVCRARRVLEYLHDRHRGGARVMVVAHGIFNTVLLMQALGVDVQRFDPDFNNTSVSRIFFYEKGTGPWGFDVRVLFLNDFSHLHEAFAQMCFEKPEGIQ